MWARIRGDILVIDRVALLLQLIEYHARVNRIPEDDHIGDQAQRAKLILLPVAVALTQLPALTVKHFTSHAVVTLATIELDERRATFILIVNVVEHVQGLIDATKLRQSLRQARGSIPRL